MTHGPFRTAGQVELARRRALAQRTVSALRAAGFLARVGDMFEEATPGAQVDVEPDLDLAGFRTLLVNWHGPAELEKAAMAAVAAHRFDDAAIRTSGGIASAMQPAIVAVLAAAGFTVRPAEDDYAPFGVEVIEPDLM